ncbi:hypothetical protein I4U23_031174 [Adineta vaga]|nr:hypothetical protein I4U23_031174 [Adineta vaga]
MPIHNQTRSSYIVVKITVDPSKSTTAFVKTHDISALEKEEEIFFSMHSVFLDLTLTNVDDPQLRNFTESMRQETFPTEKGWYRLGNLLMKLGLFDIILYSMDADYEKASIYRIFGMINNGEGKFDEAIESFGKSVDIFQKFLSPSDRRFALPCNGLGIAYINLEFLDSIGALFNTMSGGIREFSGLQHILGDIEHLLHHADTDDSSTNIEKYQE